MSVFVTREAGTLKAIFDFPMFNTTPVSYTHLDVYKRQWFYGGYGQSWRVCPMSQLLPYETIVKASEGDPEAVAAVLSHYAGYVRSCAKMDGQINTDMQEHIVRQLIESLLKFRFDR